MELKTAELLKDFESAKVKLLLEQVQRKERISTNLKREFIFHD